MGGGTQPMSSVHPIDNLISLGLKRGEALYLFSEPGPWSHHYDNKREQENANTEICSESTKCVTGVKSGARQA